MRKYSARQIVSISSHIKQRFWIVCILQANQSTVSLKPNQKRILLSYHLLCFSPIVNCHFFISFYSICQFEERCSFHPANSYRLTRWRLHNTFSAIAPRSWLCSLLCFVFLPSQEWDQDSGDLVLSLNIHTCPSLQKEKKIVLCVCNLQSEWTCLTSVCIFVNFWF